jgi:uncharacterized protein (DUF169 family)
MTVGSVLHRYGEELERLLLLRTSPIAVKLIEREEDIPAKAIRPKRDLGHHLALCQGFAMSRRNKATVAMLKEDHWCYLPVIAFGLAEPPDFFMEGKAFLKWMGDLDAAKKVASNFPHLKYGKYIGSISAPLRSAEFEPDLVVIYCNSNQLRCLLSGLKYKDGYTVTSNLDPSGACLQCTVPAIQTGDCQVTVPCGGDRANALAQDDEMIFTVPLGRMEDLLFGLKRFDEMGSGYLRFAPQMRPEYPLYEGYVKVGKMIGLDVE